MLDEAEYVEVASLYSGAMKRPPKRLPSSSGNISLENASIEQRFALSVLVCGTQQMDRHEKGMQRKCNHAPPLLAFRPSPCRGCGKPLRTPSAKLCGSCMTPVSEGLAGRSERIIWVDLTSTVPPVFATAGKV